jgi:hypothetical protein
MRCAPALVTALLVLPVAPRLAQAQNSTIDGIEALSRDDPATAARILTPLATSTASNPIARFFSAALDETGFGSDVDPVRTCGLYLSVAGSPTPLIAPALAHVEMLRREDPDLAWRCDSPGDRAAASEPAPAAAASGADAGGTRAGVAAFVAGDYETAATILKPIAERHRRLGVDAVAAFFTAAMYHSGIGLPRDPLRACALYMRAGLIYSDSRTWFERLNATFARDAYNEVPVDQQRLCELLGSIGFEHRFEPATFSLGPGHSVAFTLSGDGFDAAITYEGRERHEPVGADKVDGQVFLPLRYTELPARPPALGSRHFVEILVWVPATDTSWRLEWTLVEVAGDAVERVAQESLLDSPDRDAPN